MQVEVREDNIDNAIRFLKKAVERDGIHQEVKRREQSPNKGDRRKQKMLEAARRRLQRERRRNG